MRAGRTYIGQGSRDGDIHAILWRAKASTSLSFLLKPAPGDAHAVTRKLEETLVTRNNLRNT